jgi:hypothetical protein
MPLLIWAPSRIQRQKNAEGRVRKTNEFTFPNYGSFVWVTKGYVVLDDAAFLLLAKEQQNQTIILLQLVDNAEAAINAVDALGYINRKNSRWWSLVWCLMTALFTHSNLFCMRNRSKWCLQNVDSFGFKWNNVITGELLKYTTQCRHLWMLKGQRR